MKPPRCVVGRGALSPGTRTPALQSSFSGMIGSSLIPFLFSSSFFSSFFFENLFEYAFEEDSAY